MKKTHRGKKSNFKINHSTWWFFVVAVSIFIGLAIPTQTLAVGLVVEGVSSNGDTSPLTSYRWLIEEDTTHYVDPGVRVNNPPSVQFHTSYTPVVAKGDESDSLPALDPNKRYFISVLPKETETYSIGGAPFNGDDASVTVYLNALPLPTAQITVFIFEDNHPINNAPDIPEEAGLGGFQIKLEDAGGRWGDAAGEQMTDAFGNMLGTTYDDQGDVIGWSPLITGPDGKLTIKNLAPGKYGVTAVPPAGEGWQQTSTIEGKRIIDAWVKAGEPSYFAEFGPPGYHVFVGFIKEFTDAAVLSGGVNITGQVVNLHLSAPPDMAFYNGAPFEHTTPWVGLNDNAGLAGSSKGVYAGRANTDGTFSIPSVPPGDYQLVVWDDNLDLIFAFHNVIVGAGNDDVYLGDVPVFQWFTRLENYVFYDINEDGFKDDGEPGMPTQAINLRWRDGTLYQSTAFGTNVHGFLPFDEVFPFFSWLVVEVDFARYKATGVTVTVDAGGPIDPLEPRSFGGKLNPQLQPDNNDEPFRTETGPVLTQAFQGFLGQTSVLEWGKTLYESGENGGISGIVYYATTRAEDDPRLAAAEPWEPGIPGVTVNLYDETGLVLLNTTTTDSWDDAQPNGCPGDPFEFPVGTPLDCYDGMRNWNQVRPGVFDGGYAFMTYFEDVNGDPVAFGTAGAIETPLPAGEYVVEVIPPEGYEIVKEEDRNVDFGDVYTPKAMAMSAKPLSQLPEPICVGNGHLVPNEFSLFPLFENGNPVEPYNAGLMTPLCDRKQVYLGDTQNAAADFFLFTEVPVAASVTGLILDDTANEYDPNSPQFGEKYAPPWLGVSIHDWTGRMIAHTYSDEFGKYNMLVPSTYTTNLPAPSGMSPNMLITCMNSSVLPDGSADPFHNPMYSTFCYTFQYMPGTTTYLDTPVLPVAAFAGPDQYPVDCEFPDGTPVIDWVRGVGKPGPYVTGAGKKIVIRSEGRRFEVSNPAYDGPDGTQPKTITRDYSFGGKNNEGEVTLGGVDLGIDKWRRNKIKATIPAGVSDGDHQLIVTRGDNGKSTIIGVTVTVGGPAPIVVSNGGSIQAAIDAANPGDLILVKRGVYNEQLIMWKPVRLQGWGAGSTVINAVRNPAEQLDGWQATVQSLADGGDVDLLPGQEAALFAEVGAGVAVFAKNDGSFADTSARIDGFTISGATLGGGIVVNGYAENMEISNNRIVNNSGVFHGGVRLGHPELVSEQGTLIYTDAHNENIRIRHNQITQNGGFGGAGGGVSICTGADGYELTGNFICGNFSMENGAGVGHLGLSRNGLIADNEIIFNENFNQGRSVSGGGIFIGGQAPIGPNTLSPGSGSVQVIGNLIKGNSAGVGDGGGIRTSLVNGEDVARKPNRPGKWYAIDIYNNMIVNNVAALAGGGISMQDTARVKIIHNTIAHNDSTATSGGAFSPNNPNQSEPQPAGIVSRVHSDALANTFGGHRRVNFYKKFSNPRLDDNIIWQNRSFYFTMVPESDPPVYALQPDPSAPEFDDLGVIGTATPAQMKPRHSILTETQPALTGLRGENYGKAWHHNSDADPLFVAEYFNGHRGQTITIPEATTAMDVPIAFDEGGNSIRVRFGPLTQTLTNDPATLYGDYHIEIGSPAKDSGRDWTNKFDALKTDIDNQTRPSGSNVDIGADELDQQL